MQIVNKIRLNGIVFKLYLQFARKLSDCIERFGNKVKLRPDLRSAGIEMHYNKIRLNGAVFKLCLQSVCKLSDCIEMYFDNLYANCKQSQLN